MDEAGGPVLDRPFHFIVVLWGERFRDYFLDYCLPSLLAPGNIPALKTRQQSKFLIATRPDDWAAMRETPVFRLLEGHILPVLLEIPPCPPDKSGREYMGVGHRLACDMAFRDQAYGVLLTPDCMLSDGTIAAIQARAAAGATLVLAAALRFGEEPFLGKLREIGTLPAVSRGPLAISGREMVAAAVHGFHSETLRYEWDAPSFPPSFPDVAAAAWWNVPGEEGIVLHSASWAPLLIDYAAIQQHDTSTLQEWTLDGDYVFKNFGDFAAVHVVTDSDEMFIASWGPLDVEPADSTEWSIFGRIGKGAKFRFAFLGPIFDPLKRRLFFTTVRWHARPLGPIWDEVEARSMRTIRRYVRPPTENSAGVFVQFWNAILYVVAILEWTRRLRKLLPVWAKNNRQRIALLLRGDLSAMRWLAWTVRKLIAGLLGHSFTVPRPRLRGE